MPKKDKGVGYDQILGGDGKDEITENKVGKQEEWLTINVIAYYQTIAR